MMDRAMMIDAVRVYVNTVMDEALRWAYAEPFLSAGIVLFVIFLWLNYPKDLDD